MYDIGLTKISDEYPVADDLSSEKLEHPHYVWINAKPIHQTLSLLFCGKNKIDLDVGSTNYVINESNTADTLRDKIQKLALSTLPNALDIAQRIHFLSFPSEKYLDETFREVDEKSFDCFVSFAHIKTTLKKPFLFVTNDGNLVAKWINKKTNSLINLEFYHDQNFDKLMVRYILRERSGKRPDISSYGNCSIEKIITKLRSDNFEDIILDEKSKRRSTSSR